MRQPLWRIELYLNLPPVAVLILVVWTVSEYILVAQLYSNLRRHIGQFIGIRNRKEAATGYLGDFSQQRRPGNFFGLGGRLAEDTDGINLHIGLFHHRFDLTLSITAVIVAAVRNDQQGLFAVAGVLHLADAHIDGVQQSGTALRNRVNQFALNVFNRLGEIGAKLRTIIECDHEEFVLRVGRLEEFNDGFARLQDLVIHASAHIKNHTQRNRGIFTGKMLYFLYLTTLHHGEILFLEASHNTVPVVGHGHVYQDQIYVDLNRLGVVFKIGFSSLDRRVFRISRLGHA